MNPFIYLLFVFVNVSNINSAEQYKKLIYFFLAYPVQGIYTFR